MFISTRVCLNCCGIRKTSRVFIHQSASRKCFIRSICISIDDNDAMKWGLLLSQMEGIIPAIETAHAFAVLEKMKFSKSDIVIFNCSGRGDKDLDTYINYFKL